MTSPSQSFTVQLPKNLSKSERERVGRGIIAHIKSRTARGLDKDNRPFKPYSESYKNSVEFKAAGKGPIVNLKLTGEMLEDLQILKQGEGFVTIGFTKSGNNSKAFYAKDVRNGSRMFMGINKRDLDFIIETNRNGPTNPNLDVESFPDFVRKLIG